MKPGWLILAGFWMALVPMGRAAATFDLILRRGRVIDGAGNPAFFADVAGEGGRMPGGRQSKWQGETGNGARGPLMSPRVLYAHTPAQGPAAMPLPRKCC